MGEPKSEIAAAENADTEIELSVDDLVALADPGETKTAELAVQKAAAMALETPRTIQKPTSANADTRSNARAISHAAMFVGFMFVAIVAGVAVYTHADFESGKNVQHAWKPAFPKPTGVTDPEPPEPTPQAPPVRYANPFDPSEVFEFPAGTSRAAAREAVAEMLLQRAIERETSARK